MYTSYILGNRVNFLRFPVILLKKLAVKLFATRITSCIFSGGHGHGQAYRIG